MLREKNLQLIEAVRKAKKENWVEFYPNAFLPYV